MADISANPPAANITTFISHADGLIDAITGKTWGATPPALVEQTSTDLAAFWCLAYDPSALASNSEAALVGDMLWAAATRGLTLLQDKKIVEYLSAL